MKRSISGRWEVCRPLKGHSIILRHVLSGLPCGRFSHIAVRTLKAALQGVERAEALLSPSQLALIDKLGDKSPERQNAMDNLAWALRECFPNGGWSR